MRLLPACTCLAALAAACAAPSAGDGSFASDLAFLQRHGETAVLTSPTGARVAIDTATARVVTSSAPGWPDSLGAVDRAAVAAGIAVDGEDEALLVRPAAPLAAAAADPGEPFTVRERGTDRVVLGRRVAVADGNGTLRELDVQREVLLVDPAEVLAPLGIELGGDVRAVSFATRTTVTNASDVALDAAAAPAVRVRGTFPASPACRVLVPFVGGPERYHGPVLADGGEAPAGARVDLDRAVLELRAEAAGPVRTAVGPRRAKPRLGAWDEQRGLLTLVDFSLAVDTGGYGAVAVVAAVGPVGEGWCALESWSPVLALAPGAAATHVHRTTHLLGDPATLAAIAAHALGAGDAASER